MTVRRAAGTAQRSARHAALGRFLRSGTSTSCRSDQRAQGDMSLVGPRRTLAQSRIRAEDRSICRHNVLPGITGWGDRLPRRPTPKRCAAVSITTLLHRQLVALARPAHPDDDCFSRACSPSRRPSRTTRKSTFGHHVTVRMRPSMVISVQTWRVLITR